MPLSQSDSGVTVQCEDGIQFNIYEQGAGPYMNWKGQHTAGAMYFRGSSIAFAPAAAARAYFYDLPEPTETRNFAAELRRPFQNQAMLFVDGPIMRVETLQEIFDGALQPPSTQLERFLALDATPPGDDQLPGCVIPGEIAALRRELGAVARPATLHKFSVEPDYWLIADTALAELRAVDAIAKNHNVRQHWL